MAKAKVKYDGYVVWDTLENKLWENPKGKKFWKRKCDAGNAWTCHQPYYIKGTYDRSPSYTQQTRFVTKGVFISFETEQPKIGYMCKIDYDEELQFALGGVLIYKSIEDLKHEHRAADECGIVEVKITLNKIIQEGKY